MKNTQTASWFRLLRQAFLHCTVNVAVTGAAADPATDRAYTGLVMMASLAEAPRASPKIINMTKAVGFMRPGYDHATPTIQRPIANT